MFVINLLRAPAEIALQWIAVEGESGLLLRSRKMSSLRSRKFPNSNLSSTFSRIVNSMQTTGQERQQIPEDDDFFFTPLSSACFTISSCGVRDRDLALLVEKLGYQIDVCQRNNFEVDPDWIDKIEQSIEDAFEYWQANSSCDESTGEFPVDLSGTTFFKDGSNGPYLQLASKQGDGAGNGESESAGSQRIVTLLQDLVDQLVCDGSPGARMACEKLHDNLALLYEDNRTSLIRPFDQAYISPLSSVSSSVVVNELLRDFNTLRVRATNNPEDFHTLTVSESRLRAVREDLALLSLTEERGLHMLAGLLCHRYIGDSVTIEAQVQIKSLDDQQEESPITLKQALSRCELFSRSDIEIAESISGRRAEFIGASIIEYRPSSGESDGAVHAIRTRIKAWESLTDKVVERMFVGNTITDLSGIALVVDSEDDVRKVYEQLVRLRWSDAELRNVGLDPSDSIRGLDIFKTSDKLGAGHVHWRGIKFAGFWGDQCVEIQIKTVEFLQREQASDTPESHSNYRRDRKSRRDSNARNDPMYDFSREFIRFALLGGEPPDNCPANIRLNITSP
jgi:hypothetical protein